jgi:hypothetical protein
MLQSETKGKADGDKAKEEATVSEATQVAKKKNEATEEAKEQAAKEEHEKEAIKARQDWSKAHAADDAKVVELKKELWRAEEAEGKAHEKVATARKAAAKGVKAATSTGRSFEMSGAAVLGKPPADATSTAHPQEALMFKAGGKAPVKAKMDTFKLQAKKAADQVKTLWGFKSEGILDDSQYQKAKAQVMAELNNEASHAGKPLLTGIGRAQSLASKEVKAVIPPMNLQKASKVQEETQRRQAAADGTRNTAQLVHTTAVTSESGAVETRVTVVPDAVMPAERVSGVLKPTLAMATPRSPNSESGAEIEHTLADQEALMLKLHEQADALETKIKKSLRHAATNRPALAAVAVANEAVSVTKDVYRYLQQEKELEVKIKGAERSVETLGVKLVTAVNHGPRPQTHAQAKKLEEGVTASLPRQRENARYRVLAQQTSLMANPHAGGDKYLPQYLERENRKNLSFLRRGKNVRTQMEAEEGEGSERQEIPETYEFRIGEGGGMRAEHSLAPRAWTYDVVRRVLVNSGPVNKREQPPFIQKYESDVMKKLNVLSCRKGKRHRLGSLHLSSS